jgi:hypothetical protein
MLLSLRTCTLPLLSALAACPAEPPPAAAGVGPELELEGVGLRFFRGSELRAVGRSRTAAMERESGELKAEEIRLRLLPTASRQEVAMSAASGAGNIRSQEAEFWGAVRVKQAGGPEGATERAHLFGREHRATGTQPVELAGEGYRVHAEGGFSMELSDPGKLDLAGPTLTRALGAP